jgi:putative spermidine/putrescine transport system permease protein
VRPRLLTVTLSRGWALLVAAFLVVPAFIVVPLSLSSGMFLEFPPPGFSTQWFSDFFADPEWTSALTRSLIVASATAALAVPVGLVVAYALVRSRSRLARASEPVVMAPMMVPIVIFGFGLYLVALELGLTGHLWVVVVAHAALALPYVVVVLGAALRTVDHRLELAARVLGASPAQAFARIVVPLVGPAIVAAALLAVMLSLDEAVVALFLVGDTAPTLPVKMFASITYELNPLVPVAATVLMGATLVLVSLTAVLVRRAMRRAEGL